MSSPDAAVEAMIANLPARTGKSLTQWLKIARASGLTKHRAVLNFLKTEHGLTHGYANLVALKALEREDPGPARSADPIAAQYAGAKAGLRPIYDAIVAAVNRFGSAVEVAPKKAYVSLRRNKQFAIIQPSAANRVDIGLNLKGVAPTRRLERSGSFNAMVSHRVRLAAKADVDRELIGWLQQAYDAAGG